MSTISRYEGIDLIGLESFGLEEFAPTLPFPVNDASRLYPCGIFALGPLSFYIEYVQGGMRSGTDPEGNRWETRMPCAYGYIRDTKDADGEDFDVYINQNNFVKDAPVYVLDQLNPNTGKFDEHKGFFGYPSQESALADYAEMVPNSEKRIGGVAALPLGKFCSWVRSDGTMKPITGQFDLSPATATVSKLAVKEVIQIPTTKKAPKVTIRKRPDGVDIEIYILSEFSTKEWGGVTNTIVDLIENATANDTILIAISSYGGELDLAARIASVMRESPAQISTLSLGPVASAGCLVWCEGKERLISAGSYFMQHEAGCAIRGKTSQIAKMALVTTEYVKKIIFTRAIEIGLFTQTEIDEMVDKGVDLFIPARVAAARTNTRII